MQIPIAELAELPGVSIATGSNSNSAKTDAYVKKGALRGKTAEETIRSKRKRKSGGPNQLSVKKKKPKPKVIQDTLARAQKDKAKEKAQIDN